MRAGKYAAGSLAVMVLACTNAPQENGSSPIGEDLPSATLEETTRRIPQFENEYVEVWKSIIMPNQPLTMHRHDNPRAIISLTGGTLHVVNEAGGSRELTWEPGSAYWLEADPLGELHGDVNQGPEPVEVIVVLLKGARTTGN